MLSIHFINLYSGSLAGTGCCGGSLGSALPPEPSSIPPTAPSPNHPPPLCRAAVPRLRFSAGKGNGAGWGGGCEEPNKAGFIPPCLHLHEMNKPPAQQHKLSIQLQALAFFCKMMLPPAAYGELFMGKRFLIWKLSHFLYFMVSPY